MSFSLRSLNDRPLESLIPFSENTLIKSDSSLEFDVEQKQGRMVGKVRMVLKNSSVVNKNKKQSFNNDVNPTKNTFFFVRKINSLLEAIQENK